ncbi:MAG: Uma2 family endonuclease [Thermomicrobiales bacterium]
MAQRLSSLATIDEPRMVMTYDEFLAWAGEETRAEWVDGEVIILEMPKSIHQRLVALLLRLLSQYASVFDLGEVMIAPFEMRLIPVRSSRQPDILFVARDHLDRITVDRLDGPADLVIEVISPDSVTRDKRDKLLEYQQAGIPEYWVVDPRERHRAVEPYALTDRGVYRPIPPDAQGRLNSMVLPGFWLDPAWLWQDPLPDPLRLLAMVAPGSLQALLGSTKE